MIEFDYSDENIKRTIEKDFFDRNIYLDKDDYDSHTYRQHIAPYLNFNQCEVSFVAK